MQYTNAGQGLKKMFIAQIGSVICSVLLFIPLINLIAMVGVLVFLIISLVGLNQAGKDIGGCQKAFQFTIAQLVLSVILNFAGNGFIATIVSVAYSVAGFLVTYFVCSSVAEVLRMRSYDDIASRGEMVWKINLVCYAVEIIVSVLSHIPLLNILTGPAGIILPVASLIAGILFITFLYRSSEVL